MTLMRLHILVKIEGIIRDPEGMTLLRTTSTLTHFWVFTRFWIRSLWRTSRAFLIIAMVIFLGRVCRYSLRYSLILWRRRLDLTPRGSWLKATSRTRLLVFFSRLMSRALMLSTHHFWHWCRPLTVWGYPLTTLAFNYRTGRGSTSW